MWIGPIVLRDVDWEFSEILNLLQKRTIKFFSDAQKMGAGVSTASQSSPSPIRVDSPLAYGQSTPIPHFQTPATTPSSATHLCPHHDHPPTDRCCSHYKKNHSQHSAGVTPVRSRRNSVDEEIEEIVANTLDLPNMVPQTNKVPHDSMRKSTSQNGSGTGRRSRSSDLLDSARTRVMSVDELDLNGTNRNSDADVSKTAVKDGERDFKDTFQDVDFAKFKRVNEKGSIVLRNGKVVHHQESDLLWRLGLISPEGYTIKNPTRSAPSSSGNCLKPPSYDMNEEQLMANIEKEFAEYAGTVN